METRLFSNSNERVSVLGLGAWPLAGAMGAIEESMAVATVQAAVESGQTFIDTAEAYRTSEALVGRALAEGACRSEAFVATKVSGNYTRKHLREALENSLRHLRTDYVDLYQIHWPQEPPAIERQMEWMKELQGEGKTRFIGVSNFSLEQHQRAWSVCPFQSTQPRYNLFDRHVEAEILPWCVEHHVSVLAHSPLGKGLLAGKYRPGHVFPQDDERSQFADFQGGRFAQFLAVADRLKDVAARRRLTLPQTAIGWVLRRPEVTVCLAGAKSPEQVHENNGGQGWHFTDDELAEIEEILKGAPSG